ncbi:MAG: phosphate acyltransferase PlsX [Bacteroidales bacterium]
MRVGLDVMGGDYAPEATLSGALLAHKELSPDDKLVLIGDTEMIHAFLEKEHVPDGTFDIVASTEVIAMGEHPYKAFTKKINSSIALGFKLLKHKEIDAFASAGNSGAMLVGSIYSVNTIQGVVRPCTTTLLPQENGDISILLDIGTNPDAKPDVLYQFALLGSLYAEHVYNIKNPRVGLLNIGEEEEKGNLLCQAVFPILKNSEDIHFVGNLESRDLFKSKADVIVCDGFTGNIVIKLIEAMYRIMMKRNIQDDFFNRLNYEKYGGSPILGINAPVVLGHGISNAIAIKNMLLLAKHVAEARLPSKIKKSFKRFSLLGD